MTTYAEWHDNEQEISDDEYEALVDYLANEHQTPDDEHDADMVASFQEAYQGCYHTLGDFVEETARDLHDIPDWLDNHIDWDSVAEDWRHDYWQSNNGHVFRNY